MTERFLFLSYSRNDREPAVLLEKQFEQAGLRVFRDDSGISGSERWLNILQQKVETCGWFVVLVGRDGVRRWMGAEASVALFRNIDPQRDDERLPIFPILLGDTMPDALPGFLRQFQAVRWGGAAPLPEEDLERIRTKAGFAVAQGVIEGPPFVGLDAFQPEQSRLFFGRQRETLELLDCLGRSGKTVVRWLEIAGNSGSGKSSLMNAGLLPLVDEGWLCRKTGFDRWVRIGPMMPGDKPVRMLAEHLATAFGEEMADVRRRLEGGEELALADWLRGRKRKPDADGEAAFLFAIDQFEELFTLAEADERERFDRLLATALEDLDCPLFVLSTVRADFLDRYEELLPRLMTAQFKFGTSKRLPPIAGEGLRAVIDGPARLAALDVGEVRDLVLSEARDEPGALPLVENALRWLWEQRTDSRLSGALLREAGGIAGLLSSGADDLLDALDEEERERALRLLFRLVRVDPEGRHTRRRLSYAKAVEIAGGGQSGRALVHRLAGSQVRDGGRRRGSVRLITIGEENGAGGSGNDDGGWVNLIHETLIRARATAGKIEAHPYWPTLWRYIDGHKGQSFRLESVRMLADRIDAEARTWDATGRAENLRWSEAYIVQQMREIVEAGEAIEETVRRGASRAFFGPTNPHEIIELLSLGEADDVTRGSGRYGERWRLPLGHQARAALAERLAIVGDPRRGVGLRDDGLPDVDWCEIDGGEVWIVDQTRTVEPFRMARYPVTISQFRAFVEDCFRDGKWHLPSKLEGMFPHEDPSTHLASGGSHGADSVSWYDANAFCHWLGTRLKARSGSRPRRNGSLQPRQAIRSGSIHGAANGIRGVSRGRRTRTRAVSAARCPSGSILRAPLRVGSWIWPETSGSGAKIGTTTGASVCCAAGPGTSSIVPRARQTESIAILATGTAVSASASCVLLPPHDPHRTAAHAPAPGMGDRVMPQARSNSRA